MKKCKCSHRSFWYLFLGALGKWYGSHLQGGALLSLQNPTYLHYAKMNAYFGSFQAAVLIVLVFISAFKPWGKRS